VFTYEPKNHVNHTQTSEKDQVLYRVILYTELPQEWEFKQNGLMMASCLILCRIRSIVS